MHFDLYCRFGEILITIVDDHKVFSKLCMKLYGMELPQGSETHKGMQCNDIVYVKDPLDMATFGHEIIHAIDYYMEKRVFLINDTEVRAHLFSLFYEMYQKRISKIKQHKRKK